jgi:hypothetical protein
MWDAAEDRAERASLCTLLQYFAREPVVEQRLARDYLFSLRAGDRHLAAMLEGASERAVAVYAQVILRRLQRGRGLARYAVRHLARRGDGQAVLGAVLGSDRFLPRDKLAVLEAHPDRSWWAAMLAPLAVEHGVLPRTDLEGLTACVVHPEPAVRDLAQRALRLETGATHMPRGTWEDHLRDWGIVPADLDQLVEEGIAAGMAAIEAHGEWLQGLKSVQAPVEVAPRRSLPTFAFTVLQEWDGDLLRIRVAPAPSSVHPRIEVTLRDDDGCIVDLFELAPVSFEGTVAIFEAWRFGKRASAVSASVRVKDSLPE